MVVRAIAEAEEVEMTDGSGYACGFLDGTVLATYLIEETLAESNDLKQLAEKIRSRIHAAQVAVCKRRGEELAQQLIPSSCLLLSEKPLVSSQSPSDAPEAPRRMV